MMFCIQVTGVLPIKISRIVPPPMAVTNAMMKMPNRSNLLFMAERAPEIAKAVVPNKSRMLNSDISIMMQR